MIRFTELVFAIPALIAINLTVTVRLNQNDASIH
jgi:hypothetical protein